MQIQTLMWTIAIALSYHFAAVADPPTKGSVANAPYGKKLRWACGIYDGTSPTDLTPSKTIQNPVFTIADVTRLGDDVRGMVAVHIFDPFVVQQGTRHYLFFELCGFSDFKYGCDIAYASSDDALTW